MINATQATPQELRQADLTHFAAVREWAGIPRNCLSGETLDRLTRADCPEPPPGTPEHQVWARYHASR